MSKSLNTAVPRIVVLYGGVGLERDVSLVSGKAILNAMTDDFPYEVCGIVLEQKQLPATIDPSRDVVLLALHGEFGEDGQIQSLLEQAGILYAGCDAMCSALCMDKARTKRVWLDAALPVVEGCTLLPESWDSLCGGTLWQTYPGGLVLKPISMGSSVGLHLFNEQETFEAFLADPESRKQSWLLERRIRGREFSVGVLDGQAMGIVEIRVPDGRVYDYEQKYHRGDTVYECPATLDDADMHYVKFLAQRAYEACGCRDYARIDFLMETSGDGKCFCLELNTLPGMTPTSLLPKSALSEGLGFRELLLKMVAPCVQRFRLRAESERGA